MKKALVLMVVSVLAAGLLSVVGCGGGTGKQGGTWVNTDGGVSAYVIDSLAYDSAHNVLYAGTFDHGTWKYGSTP